MFKTLKQLFCRHRWGRLIPTPGRVVYPDRSGDQLYRIYCKKCGSMRYGSREGLLNLRRTNR